jgi:hypothetical protein
MLLIFYREGLTSAATHPQTRLQLILATTRPELELSGSARSLLRTLAPQLGVSREELEK